MNSELFFSKFENCYFYSAKINQFLLFHPFLYLLYVAYKDNKNIEKLIEKLKTHYRENNKDIAEIDYYYSKFLLLQKNGYFDDVDLQKKFSGKLTSDVIKSSLANTSQVSLEMTEACNFKCHYCGFGELYKHQSHRKNKAIEFNKIKTLLDYLLQYWNSPLNISHEKEIVIGFYGGEPLLNFATIKNVVDYSKKIKLERNHFGYNITTNGVLLNKHIDFLAENNFRILISLDGNKKNNEYRVFLNGNPSFDTVYENARLIQDNYPEYFKKKVGFNVVFHSKNSIQEIHEFFKSNFDKIPSIAEVSDVGISPNKIAEFNETYRNIDENIQKTENKDEIEKDFFVNLPPTRRAAKVLSRYSGYFFKSYFDLMATEEDVKYLPTGTCIPFSRKIFLSSRGKILPCERIDHNYFLGFVGSNQVRIDCDKIASIYNQYYLKVKNLCLSCCYIESCPKCIFNLNISDDNVKCKSYLNSNNYSASFSEAFSLIENKPELYFKIKNEYYER